jgi:hypothetical protein
VGAYNKTPQGPSLEDQHKAKNMMIKQREQKLRMKFTTTKMKILGEITPCIF